LPFGRQTAGALAGSRPRYGVGVARFATLQPARRVSTACGVVADFLRRAPTLDALSRREPHLARCNHVRDAWSIVTGPTYGSRAHPMCAPPTTAPGTVAGGLS